MTNTNNPIETKIPQNTYLEKIQMDEINKLNEINEHLLKALTSSLRKLPTYATLGSLNEWEDIKR